MADQQENKFSGKLCQECFHHKQGNFIKVTINLLEIMMSPQHRQGSNNNETTPHLYII